MNNHLLTLRLAFWISVLLIVTCDGGFADQADPESELPTADLRLVRVTLHSSGVGLFEYEGEISETAVFSIQVPRREINQLMRTATVFDPSKRGTIRLPAAQDPLKPVIPLPNSETLGALLVSMRGEQVSLVQRSGTQYSGRLVAVEIRTEVDSEQLVEREHISVLTDEGLKSFPLAEIESVLPENEAFRERLNHALDRLPASGQQDFQQIEFLFGKDKPRTVRVLILRDVPVWKSTYVADLVGLRHRAIVENVTEHDWQDITLILADGSPIAFDIDLASIGRVDRPYQKRPMRRPQIAPVLGEAESIGSDDLSSLFDETSFGSGLAGGGGMGGGMGGFGGIMMGGDGEATGMADDGQATGVDFFADSGTAADPFEDASEQASTRPRRGPSADRIVASQSLFQDASPEATGGGEGQSMFLEYKGATVPAGKTVLLDMAIQPVTISLVSVFREDYAAAKPMLAFELESTSPYRLPAGPITVFLNDRGYGGEAMLPLVSPGVTQLVAFAIDEGVRVTRQTDDVVTRREGIVFDDHNKTVSAIFAHLRQHRYEIRNRSGAQRTVLVEHRMPQSPFEVAPLPEGAMQTAFGYRLKQQVSDGETSTLEVSERHDETQTKAFATWPMESLREWAADNELDETLRAKILRLLEDREAFDLAMRTGAKLVAKRAEITAEIDRVTDQLRSKDDTRLPTELMTRYQNRLVELEDRLDETNLESSQLAEQQAAIAVRLGKTLD